MNVKTAGIIVVIVVVAVAYNVHTKNTYQAMADGVEMQHELHVASVKSAASAITSTNAKDEMFASIARDCSFDDRVRLDELLSTMQSLSSSELVELNALYDECGNYFEMQRALKAKRLQFELSELEAFYTAFPSYLTNEREADVAAFQSLLRLENGVAENMLTLAAIQSTIIDALVSGELPNSGVITTQLSRAQELRENVYFNSQEANNLRATIIE